ncbi:type 1 glutamine amidotransferase domain-containing protein [Actinospica robiniae]|uniref:type 1 glutamine amidotransferase domain-containing protein n=1 Tax=Actinospica robiniae TaxID=304901 RepID=UPI0003F80C94|nr:type 1 glutamine amidotransferase domain-containing protein [Actinospica robiniae]
MDPENEVAYENEVLAGLEVAFLIAIEGAEESETLQPWEAVAEAGGHAVLLSPQDGHAQLFEYLDRGTRLPVDRTLAEVSPHEFDALVLPGGAANADLLRGESKAVDFTRAIFAAGKPVAAIGHAPWLLVEADLVTGRSLTSWPSLRTDIRNAGGNWRDEPVVLCESGPNVLITSRGPDDLPIFCDTLVQRFAETAPG